MTRTPTRTLAALIVADRQRTGESRRQQAERIGVTETTLRRWESGVIPTDRYRIAAAARGLRISDRHMARLLASPTASLADDRG